MLLGISIQLQVHTMVICRAKDRCVRERSVQVRDGGLCHSARVCFITLIMRARSPQSFRSSRAVCRNFGLLVQVTGRESRNRQLPISRLGDGKIRHIYYSILALPWRKPLKPAPGKFSSSRPACSLLATIFELRHEEADGPEALDGVISCSYKQF